MAGTKKQLGSAITDDNGNYKIDFEYDKLIDVDISACPDVDEKVLKLMPKAKHLISKDTWALKSPYYAEMADIAVAVPLWKLWETICKKYTIYLYRVLV